ncbi:hypothetical protein NGM67_08830 [Photobacterium damselae]|uniref:hypothetical protein n=1 Tax=Photobacterium damselae TaxID=38293 RepID=UPI002091927C|nr:hypothetical protein [Photobacterium damselae]USR77867.1 hypothetical protein NGM67_08830 [Photobacterium damselae]
MRKNPSVFNALGFFYGRFSSFNVMNNGKSENIGIWSDLLPIELIENAYFITETNKPKTLIQEFE